MKKFTDIGIGALVIIGGTLGGRFLDNTSSRESGPTRPRSDEPELQDIANFDEAKSVLDAATATYDAMVDEQTRIHGVIGEGCLHLIRLYTDAGFGVDEAAVGIVLEPGQPCGGSVLNTSIHMHDVARAADNISVATGAKKAAQALVDDYEEAIEGDRNFSGTEEGLRVGVTSVIAWKFIQWRRNRGNNKNREQVQVVDEDAPATPTETG